MVECSIWWGVVYGGVWYMVECSIWWSVVYGGV